ncbi:hypothetical protein [Roseospira visakhapatnamensis]|uniref:Uncharacterized protein n=1 Tax=Roseospira visakhapatnamensis TaxID=390880 RepID=A0A7W6W8R8_9PROT|nr:hypothetical protein [Roseospira visakhapatnamensis]MBB4264662.1 hypothetical protein [Roseospira visakhapatnamensis]
MTDSRPWPESRARVGAAARAVVALAVLAVLGLAPGIAAAQGRPLPLLPGASSGPGVDTGTGGGAPPPLGPAREIAPPPGGLSDSERGIPGDGAPASAGPASVPITLGAVRIGPGGLPAEPWVGTPLNQAVGLVATLPVGGSSPVVADLRRRLLLTEQMAPGATQAAVLDLLRARVAVLDRLGAPADAVLALTDPVPPAMRDEALDRARLRALLLEARDQPACALAAKVGAGHAAALWQQAAVHCALLAGKADQAMLGLAVLREMGGTADDAFFRLAERLAGLDSPPPDSLAGASVVTYRLLRRAEGVSAPADGLRDDDPWTARTLALAGTGPAEVLAAAAERAASLGTLSVETLGDLWARLPVDPRDLQTPVSQVVLGDRSLDRALAHAILFRETDPARLAEDLLHPLETVRERHPALYPVHARLYAPLIRRVPVLPAVPVFLGVPAGRALYTAGSVEAGRVWLADLRRQGRTDTDAEDAAALLWPLARVADAALDGPLPTDQLILWRQARAARLGEGADASRTLDRAHVLLLRVLEALGAPVTEAHWLPVRTNRVFFEVVTMDGGHHDPDRLAALAVAAEAGQVGAVVANVLLALGPDGPGGASLETLGAVLPALRRVGLKAEARRMAVEALVAHGF